VQWLQQELCKYLTAQNRFLDLQHVNLWIGSNLTVAKLHFDPYDNLLCQISGKKTLKLYSPVHNENLYEGKVNAGFQKFVRV